MGIFEGDIAIGPVDKLEKSTAAADAAGLARDMPASGSGRAAPNVQFAVAITGQRYRLPGGLIPSSRPTPARPTSTSPAHQIGFRAAQDNLLDPLRAFEVKQGFAGRLTLKREM